MLKYCKSISNYLIVGINGNNYLYNKYGREFTIDLKYRIQMIELTNLANEIIVFEESLPIELIKNVNPDCFVKGNDYKNCILPEADILKELNIELLIQNESKINSSTKIIFGSKPAINFN